MTFTILSLIRDSLLHKRHVNVKSPNKEYYKVVCHTHFYYRIINLSSLYTHINILLFLLVILFLEKYYMLGKHIPFYWYDVSQIIYLIPKEPVHIQTIGKYFWKIHA